ncbi:MAG: T9SS type A sorting domain-containing protein, partial [Chitinophagaceae bacterium]|nr:T9SS type A sorting domain-containing protein [Chitinophagaceae bacterium]
VKPNCSNGISEFGPTYNLTFPNLSWSEGIKSTEVLFYPNPTNGILNVIYQLPEKDVVEIFLYDLSGQKISELLTVEQNAGVHAFRIDLNHNLHASGMYLIELRRSGMSLIRRIQFHRP